MNNVITISANRQALFQNNCIHRSNQVSHPFKFLGIFFMTVETFIFIEKSFQSNSLIRSIDNFSVSYGANFQSWGSFM